jgi:hypothetical protein
LSGPRPAHERGEHVRAVWVVLPVPQKLLHIHKLHHRTVAKRRRRARQADHTNDAVLLTRDDGRVEEGHRAHVQ